MVGMIVVNADALRTRLEEIKSRTKSCIDISARLVHKSVSHLQKSRHNLHIVNRSQELLDKFLKTRESQSLFRELPDNDGVADEMYRCGSLRNESSTYDVRSLRWNPAQQQSLSGADRK